MGQTSWHAKARLDNVRGLLRLYRSKNWGHGRARGSPPLHHCSALLVSSPPLLFPPWPAPTPSSCLLLGTPLHHGLLKVVPWGLAEAGGGHLSITPGDLDLTVITRVHPQLRPEGIAPFPEAEGLRTGSGLLLPVLDSGGGRRQPEGCSAFPAFALGLRS